MSMSGVTGIAKDLQALGSSEEAKKAATAVNVVTKLMDWVGFYSKNQKAQMRRIHKIYRVELGLDPNEKSCELRMEDDSFNKPLWKPTDTSFDVHHFDNKLKGLAGRPLTKHIREILPKITAWQKKRQNSLFESPKANDPVNLVVEEFKRFLVHVAEADVKTISKEIEQRIRYVAALQQAEEFLDSERSGWLLMERALHKQLQPEVVKKLSETNVQEILEELVEICTNLIIDGAQYLFYCIRSNSKTPKHITINDMRDPTKLYIKPMDTRTGRVLHALVWGPAFQYLEPPSSDIYPSELEPELRLPSIPTTDAAVEYDTKEQFFLDDGGAPRIPGVVLVKLPDKELRKIGFGDAAMIEYFSPVKRSGICQTFRMLPKEELAQVLRRFLLLHGLLYKLADFVLVCKDIIKVARIGSELLLYAVAKKEVLYTMLLGKKLLEKTRITARSLYEITTSKAFDVFPNDKHWRANRAQSVPLFYSIVDNAEKCYDLVQRVYTNANVDISDLINKAQELSATMIMRATKFCQGNTFLGLKLSNGALVEDKDRKVEFIRENSEDFGEEGENIHDVCKQMSKNIELSDKKHNLKKIKACFTGKDGVNWLIQEEYATTREEAITLGKSMLEKGLISYVNGSKIYEDKSNIYYTFNYKRSVRDSDEDDDDRGEADDETDEEETTSKKSKNKKKEKEKKKRRKSVDEDEEDEYEPPSRIGKESKNSSSSPVHKRQQTKIDLGIKNNNNNKQSPKHVEDGKARRNSISRIGPVSRMESTHRGSFSKINNNHRGGSGIIGSSGGGDEEEAKDKEENDQDNENIKKLTTLISEGMDLRKICLQMLQSINIDEMSIGKKDMNGKKIMYKNCFAGEDAVTWLVDLGFVNTRSQAMDLGRIMLKHKFFLPLTTNEKDGSVPKFEDKKVFYQFAPDIAIPSIMLTQEDSSLVPAVSFLVSPVTSDQKKAPFSDKVYDSRLDPNHSNHSTNQKNLPPLNTPGSPSPTSSTASASPRSPFPLIETSSNEHLTESNRSSNSGTVQNRQTSLSIVEPPTPTQSTASSISSNSPGRTSQSPFGMGSGTATKNNNNNTNSPSHQSNSQAFPPKLTRPSSAASVLMSSTKPINVGSPAPGHVKRPSSNPFDLENGGGISSSELLSGQKPRRSSLGSIAERSFSSQTQTPSSTPKKDSPPSSVTVPNKNKTPPQKSHSLKSSSKSTSKKNQSGKKKKKWLSLSLRKKKLFPRDASSDEPLFGAYRHDDVGLPPSSTPTIELPQMDQKDLAGLMADLNKITTNFPYVEVKDISELLYQHFNKPDRTLIVSNILIKLVPYLYPAQDGDNNSDEDGGGEDGDDEDFDSPGPGGERKKKSSKKDVKTNGTTTPSKSATVTPNSSKPSTPSGKGSGGNFATVTNDKKHSAGKGDHKKLDKKNNSTHHLIDDRGHDMDTHLSDKTDRSDGSDDGQDNDPTKNSYSDAERLPAEFSFSSLLSHQRGPGEGRDPRHGVRGGGGGGKSGSGENTATGGTETSTATRADLDKTIAREKVIPKQYKDSIKEGFMFKRILNRGRHLQNPWVRVYCVLFPHQFIFFRHHKSIDAMGQMSINYRSQTLMLKQVSIERGMWANVSVHPFSFKSSRDDPNKPPKMFATLTGPERTAWVEAIRTQIAQQGPLFMGYLRRESSKMKRWSERWFVLFHRSVAYFDDETQLMSPAGELHIKASTSVEPDENIPGRFYIKTAPKRWVLEATNNEERKLWIETIENAILSASSSNFFSATTFTRIPTITNTHTTLDSTASSSSASSPFISIASSSYSSTPSYTPTSISSYSPNRPQTTE